MGLFDSARKDAKKMKLAGNRERGKIFEGSFHQHELAKGNSVERRPDRLGGWDFDVTEREPLSGKAKRKVKVECKSSKSAKLTQKQKKAKKTSKNYQVARPLW